MCLLFLRQGEGVSITLGAVIEFNILLLGVVRHVLLLSLVIGLLILYVEVDVDF